MLKMQTVDNSGKKTLSHDCGIHFSKLQFETGDDRGITVGDFWQKCMRLLSGANNSGVVSLKLTLFEKRNGVRNCLESCSNFD
jgi:hypothetical protein